MNEQPSYTEAFEELQEIVTKIEQGEISVDELSELIPIAELKSLSTLDRDTSFLSIWRKAKSTSAATGWNSVVSLRVAGC